jgi:hypothetical protein
LKNDSTGLSGKVYMTDLVNDFRRSKYVAVDSIQTFIGRERIHDRVIDRIRKAFIEGLPKRDLCPDKFSIIVPLEIVRARPEPLIVIDNYRKQKIRATCVSIPLPAAKFRRQQFFFPPLISLSCVGWDNFFDSVRIGWRFRSRNLTEAEKRK